MQWPWQKKDDARKVTIFNFDTQQFRIIPAAELAPGMVAVQMEGVAGEVWVESARLQQSAFQHPPFSEAVRAQLHQIKDALDEVYPMSLEQWEEGFRRDRNPEPEIAHWLHLAQVYARLATPNTDLGNSLERRTTVFKLLVGCGIAPREQILSVTDRDPLTRDEAESVITAFYADGTATFRPAPIV